MAFAAVASSGSGSINGNATVTIPGTKATDDYVIIFIRCGTESATITADDGTWVALTPAPVVTGTGGYVFWKKISSSESNPSFTRTTGRLCWAVYRINGHDTTQAPEMSGTIATGSSAGPNPSSVTPTGGSKDYLTIEFAFLNDGRRSFSAASTGYVNLISQGTGGGGGPGAVVGTANGNFTLATIDPDAMLSGSSAWQSAVVAIHPAAGSTPDTPQFDAILIIKSSATPQFDGKAQIKDVTTVQFDGKAQIKDVTTVQFDGKAQVKDSVTPQFDGKAQIKDEITVQFDGKVEVKDSDSFQITPVISTTTSVITLTGNTYAYSSAASPAIFLEGGVDLISGKKYLILYNVSFGANDVSALAEVFLVDDGGNVDYAYGAGEGEDFGDDEATRISNLAGAFIYTSDGTDMEYAYRTIAPGDQIWMAGATIMAIPLEGLVEDTDYWYVGDDLQDTPVVETATGTVTVNTLTKTLPEAGNYLVFSSCEAETPDSAGPGDGDMMRLKIDGVIQKESFQKETEDLRDRHCFSYARVHNLTAASHTFIVEGASQKGTSDKKFYRSRIAVFKASRFDQIAFDQEDSSTAITAQYPSSDTGTTVVYVPNQNESVVVINNAIAWRTGPGSAMMRTGVSGTAITEFASEQNLPGTDQDRGTYTQHSTEALTAPKTYNSLFSETVEDVTNGVDPETSFYQYVDTIVWSMSVVDRTRDTQQFDGKVVVQTVLSDTPQFDGKAQIKDETTVQFDGLAQIKDETTVQFDGKAQVKDEATAQFDGKAQIKDETTVQFDGKAQVKDETTVQFDGKTIVQLQPTVQFDGKAQIKDSETAQFDGLAHIKDVITVQFDGKTQIKDSDIPQFDGLAVVKDSTTSQFDGKAQVKDETTVQFDGLAKVLKKDTVEFDGLVIVKDSLIVQFDGLAVVKDSVTAQFDARAKVKIIREKAIAADGFTEKTITVDGFTEKTVAADGFSEKTIVADGFTEKTIDGSPGWTEKVIP